MSTNASTESQRRFIESLARKVGDERFDEAFAAAARINANSPRGAGETVNQAAKRLTKTAASKLIDSLKAVA